MPKIPTVHLNGTSGETLAEQQYAVGKALVKLAEALKEAAPNARDYYTQEPNAFEHARNEHHARIAMLDRIRIDTMEIVIGIQDQIDAHAARKASR